MKWLKKKDVLNLLKATRSEIQLTVQNGQIMGIDAVRLNLIQEIETFVNQIEGKEIPSIRGGAKGWH